MRKTLSIPFALALVLSFSLVATTPVAAATINVPGDYATIQEAVDAANPAGGDTIVVAAGTYAGAIVSKQVSIVGDAGGGSVISSGVPYKDGSSLTTAFRLDAGADGTEIRNFTVNCNAAASFYFAVFSRGVDDVTIDGLTVNDTVQGINNWGGSGWAITNNRIIYTVAASGGGIAIFLGALPPSYRTCSDNLVQYNVIDATATAASYSCPGISVSLDTRYGAYDYLNFSEDVSGNQILDNTVIGNGGLNSAGIEIGVIGVGGDSTKIAATLGLVDDNTVKGNTIADVDMGLYLYTITNLAAENNDITGCNKGVYMKDGNAGNAVSFNNIYGNANYGVENTSGVSLDARWNWWGDDSGPYHTTLNPDGAGNAVTDDVLFDPWLGAKTVTGPTGPVTFTSSDGSIEGLAAVAPPSLPSVSFPHGMFSFKITGLDPGQTVTLTIELPGPVPVGTVWWKYDNGRWYSLPNLDDDGDNIMKIRLTDGGSGDSDSVPGQITDPGGPGNPMTVGWEGSPISKSAVLWPWIALLTAIVGGLALLVLRHRRAER